MAILNIPVRATCAGAFAAAIVITPVVGISAGAGADFRTVADPCTQVNTSGSVSLQCGSQRVIDSGRYSGGCTTPYGTYQNCIVQLGPPGARR
jgi:hypothetical protein